MITSTSSKVFRNTVLFFALCGALILGAQQAQAAVEVFVSIPPQKWLSDRIGGEHITTGVLVRKGQDPHTFEPTPKLVEALTRSRLYFTIGLEFEEQVIAKIRQSSANLKIVDSVAGIEKMAMAERDHDGEGRHHGDGHDNDHAALDPHVWLSPVNLKIIAADMARTLIAADPQHSSAYAANLDQLSRELDELDRKIAAQLQPYAGATFFVFHPSFGYFAKRYGLQQEAVEVEGKTPTPKQLSGLIAEAKADRVKVIFVQPQFDPHSGQAVATAIGGDVVPLDPLAEDVAENLETIAARISSALAKK